MVLNLFLHGFLIHILFKYFSTIITFFYRVLELWNLSGYLEQRITINRLIFKCSLNFIIYLSIIKHILLKYSIKLHCYSHNVVYIICNIWKKVEKNFGQVHNKNLFFSWLCSALSQCLLESPDKTKKYYIQSATSCKPSSKCWECMVTDLN